MASQSQMMQDPHAGQPVVMAGEPLGRAGAAMLMIHGRGARAEDILSLAEEFHQPGYTYLAPQASDNSWYPNRFLVPMDQNQPWLSSALAFVDRTLAQIIGAGIAYERVILLGFSQGACLTLEYAARHARRYGGIVGLSGALIGPDDTPRNYPGSLAGAPIFLGCSNTDFHVPKECVDETAEVMRRLDGSVTERLYPNLDHTVNQDEIDFVRDMMSALIGTL